MPTLKDLRNAAGLSQTELANASGVSLETIKKIETGKVERPHPATLRLLAAVLGQVPAVMHGANGSALFDPHRFENSRRDHTPYLCVLGLEGSRLADGFVPLRRTTLYGSISGPLARLQLVQVFGYSRAELDRVVEAAYRFPLPGDAAVTSVRVRFGDVVIQTKLAARLDAEREYAAARQAGRQAALATRESADVLTLKITGLQPDQEVIVETTFVQAATAEGTGWQLRVPLTIGPRYTRADESGSAASRGQPLQVWRDPRHRFSLDVDVHCARGVSSSSHALAVTSEMDADAQHVGLAEQSVIGDRDLVLSWLPRQQESRPALQVLTHEDLDEGMRYFLALITPPGDTRAWPGVDREVLLLVDRSGSMAGPKWEACRWAVRRFLAGLTPADTFNLGLFESHCVWLDGAAVPGTDANRRRALEFLDGHGPQGGTELGRALEQALRSDPTPGRRARQVLLVTDAQVSDESRIVQLVEQDATQPEGRRVSVISIDSAPRSAFVRALAEAAGGEAVFLTSEPDEEDITSALDRVLDTWARPLATDAELTVEASAASVQARHAAGVTRSSIRLGDLPTGRSLWVSGAVSLFSEPTVRLMADQQVLAEEVLNLDAAAREYAEVRSLFGARQIARLERLEAQNLEADARDAVLDELGYANDPLRAPRSKPVYAENASAEGTVVHRLLVRESLRYGLMCSATAFVGERVEAGRRVEVSVEVPSALPLGWSESFATGGAVRAITMPRMAARLRAEPPGDAVTMSAHPGAFAPPPAPMAGATEAAPALALRFSGTPREVTLVRGVAGTDVGLRLHRLVAGVDGEPAALDPRVVMSIWVDGQSLVSVGLRELLELGGERPLNLALAQGAQVEVRLEGDWAAVAGILTVAIS